jgi:hypothetical protein
MEEISTIAGADPAEDSVVDLYECPRCHCVDERHRTRSPKSNMPTSFADDSSKV